MKRAEAGLASGTELEAGEVAECLEAWSREGLGMGW